MFPLSRVSLYFCYHVSNFQTLFWNFKFFLWEGKNTLVQVLYHEKTTSLVFAWQVTFSPLL